MMSESALHASSRERPRRIPGGRLGLAALVAALGCVVAACGTTSTHSSNAGAPGTGSQKSSSQTVVLARSLSGIGSALVNSSGRTVYTNNQDTNGKIKCTGSCVSFWIPVTMKSGASLTLPKGFSGKLGTIRRPDNGQMQVTYNGKPLYTFQLDTAAGQDHGNNYTDQFGSTSFLWQAVTATAQAKSSPSSSGGGGGGGYGY